MAISRESNMSLRDLIVKFDKYIKGRLNTEVSNKYWNEIKKRILMIEHYLEKHDESICLGCGKDFNDCGCFYDISNGYIELIQEVFDK